MNSFFLSDCEAYINSPRRSQWMLLIKQSRFVENFRTHLDLMSLRAFGSPSQNIRQTLPSSWKDAWFFAEEQHSFSSNANNKKKERRSCVTGVHLCSSGSPNLPQHKTLKKPGTEAPPNPSPPERAAFHHKKILSKKSKRYCFDLPSS